MNGNITKEGITARSRMDEAGRDRRVPELRRRTRHAAGRRQAAGLHDAGVERRLPVRRPRWPTSLGLEEAIAGSPGWSESGGPWVHAGTGDEEARVERDAQSTADGRSPARCAKPPSTTGPVPEHCRCSTSSAALSGQPQPRSPELYRDIAVIAYRVPSGDVPIATLHPTVTSSGGTFDAAALSDGDFVKGVSLPIPPGERRAWIQFEFAAGRFRPRDLWSPWPGSNGRSGRRRPARICRSQR